MSGTGLVRIRTMRLARLDEAAIAPLLPLLDEEERRRAARFAFPRRRVEFIAAHALARATLAAATGVPAAAFRFRPGAHGKPAALLGGREAPVSFNLSHTAGMVGVAVAAVPALRLGFDLEAAARQVRPEVARNVFRPEELAWLAGLPAAEWQTGFLRLWTLKEAFIKATGRGLGQDLSRFWFDLPPPRIRFLPGVPERAEEWLFEQRLLEGGFLGAVGLHRAQPGAPVAFAWEDLDLPALLRELGMASG